MNRSYTSLSTSSGRASFLSILLSTTMTGRERPSAFFSTKRVWGSGPSEASTSRITPSTMESARSTSPPKSAWPGVSRMLMRTPFQPTAQFFAEMVMPRSRSSSMLSMRRSSTTWSARNMPLCLKRPSTSVVLPWSTCAMIAMLRRDSLRARELTFAFLWLKLVLLKCCICAGFPTERCRACRRPRTEERPARIKPCPDGGKSLFETTKYK